MNRDTGLVSGVPWRGRTARPVKVVPEYREWYQVNEAFTSVQGEGVHTGIPATFIRLQGCTVGCSWCDSGPLADEIEGKRRTNGQTANTWGRGGRRMTVEEILVFCTEQHVIITGGEPTLWDLDGLIKPLRDAGHFIQLETSGQNELKGALEPDWVTWSPKANLGYQAPTGIRYSANEIKYVVDTDLQYTTILDEMLAQEQERGDDMPTIVLMPEGCPPKPENIEKSLRWLQYTDRKQRRFMRFGDRLQYRLGVR